MAKVPRVLTEVCKHTGIRKLVTISYVVRKLQLEGNHDENYIMRVNHTDGFIETKHAWFRKPKGSELVHAANLQ